MNIFVNCVRIFHEFSAEWGCFSLNVKRASISVSIMNSPLKMKPCYIVVLCNSHFSLWRLPSPAVYDHLEPLRFILKLQIQNFNHKNDLKLKAKLHLFKTPKMTVRSQMHSYELDQIKYLNVLINNAIQYNNVFSSVWLWVCWRLVMKWINAKTCIHLLVNYEHELLHFNLCGLNLELVLENCIFAQQPVS